MNKYLLPLLIIFITQASASPTVGPNDDCANVPPMCYKLISPKYTKMRLPNMLNHTRYEDVAADIQVWRPLLNSSKCNANNQLKYFLCFTYAPVCVDKLISPCKSLCEAVRDSCDPVMRQYNYSWPAFFNCDQRHKFQNDASQMCINLKMLGISPKRKLNECSCKGSYTNKTLESLICKSDFVVSAWVTKQVRHQIDVKPSRFFYRKPSVKNSLKAKSIRMLLSMTKKDKKHCRCNKLRVKKKARGSGRYLIIGNKIGGKIKVKAMKKMEKRQEIINLVKKCFNIS